MCPENHRARFLLVSCAMNADDFPRAREEALRIYKDLSADHAPSLMGDSVLHLSIAHASKMCGHIEEAMRFATEATELCKDDPQPYMVLGELLHDQERYEEAEQRCRQALALSDSSQCQHPLNPQNAYFALCCLGSCLLKQGKPNEAEISINRAVRAGVDTFSGS